MSKYDKFKDNTGIIIDTKNEVLKLACCDCGLVHYNGITIKYDKHVLIGFKRDSRATAQLRRHKYGNLQNGSSKYRLVKCAGDAK